MAFVLLLQSCVVTALVDAKNVMFLWRRGGSRIASQHIILVEMWYFCRRHGIDLRIEWVPRELNQHADALSKLRDRNDYSIRSWLFRSLSRQWGSVI